MITTDNRVGINQKEIAALFNVHYTTVGNWRRRWTGDTEHPFPLPTAQMSLWITRRNGGIGWSKPFLCYNRDDMLGWHQGLRAAKSRRHSVAMRKTNRLTTRPGVPMYSDRALAEIRKLRAEVDGLKVLVQGKPIDDIDF